MKLLSVSDAQHLQLPLNAKKLKFDFDDAYQYQTAKYFQKTIVTMDSDFKKVKDVPVLFL